MGLYVPSPQFSNSVIPALAAGISPRRAPIRTYAVDYAARTLCVYPRQPPARSDLHRRHFRPRAPRVTAQAGEGSSFTRRYQIDKLVWMEMHETMYEAIAREKQIKRWSKKRRRGMIDAFNPKWRDLYSDLA